MTETKPARAPQRGEIWYVKVPSDPPDKGPRPVVVVSIEARNAHERATTVLVVPLSTTPAKAELASHIPLSRGETGLSEPSTLQCENITTVRKESLQEAREKLRRLPESVIQRVAKGVVVALGFPELSKRD